MEYQSPFLCMRDIVHSNNLLLFEKVVDDIYVGTTSCEIIIYQYEDLLVEIFRQKVYTEITDLKCFNGRIYISRPGQVDVLKLDLNSNSLEVLQSFPLGIFSSKSSRFNLGYRICVCQKGLLVSSLQENFAIIPLTEMGLLSHQSKYDLRINGSVIWSFEIVGNDPENPEFSYVVLITSNANQRRNELRLLKTNFQNSTQKLVVVTPKESEPVFSRIVATGKHDNFFLVLRGSNIEYFEVSRTGTILEIAQFRVVEPPSIVSAVGWFGSGSSRILLAGCDNGEIFAVDGFARKSLKKKRIAINYPICRFIHELDTSLEKLEEEEEGEHSDMSDEENEEEEDEESFSGSIFCLFEKSKPSIYEIEGSDLKMSLSCTLPSVFPVLDFDVNPQRREFLVGSTNHLSHVQKGIHCGMIFQTPADSYPGISRLFITKSSLQKDSVDSLIFLSCVQANSTSILGVSEEGEIDPLDPTLNRFEENDDTIHVNCVGEGLVLQVTTKKVLLARQGSKGWEIVSSWNPKEIITHASVSKIVTVIGSNSNHIQLLESSTDPVHVKLRSETWVGGGEEITCISRFQGNYFAVGFFSGNVLIFDLQTLVVKGKVSLPNTLPEESREQCVVESLILDSNIQKPNSILIFSGLRNGWVAIQEMVFAENESTMIRRSYVQKIGVSPVSLVACPDLPFRVSAVSSRVLMIEVKEEVIHVLPMDLMRNNVSKMASLFTNDHKNTILTVSEDERLEIWKMNPNSMFISSEYLRGRKCYRVFFLQHLNCYIFFSQQNDRASIGVFYKEDDSVNYCHSEIHNFPANEIPYGFYEWRAGEDEKNEERTEETFDDSNFQKKQNIVVGTSRNTLYLFDIGETRERTSRKRIFVAKLRKRIVLFRLKKKKKKREEFETMEDEEEKNEEEEEGNEDEKNNEKIVYAIHRYHGKYFIVSSSEELYLLDVEFELLSKSRVRHFVYSIECVDDLRGVRKERMNDEESLIVRSENEKNIYVSDQYDSVMVLRIEDHTKSLVYVQSEKKSRSNIIPKLFDVKKDGSSDILVGADRVSREFFVLRFKEDMLERKISGESGSIELSSDTNMFSELKCVSNVFLEDIPIRVKVWRHPRHDHEMVLGALLSGKIFQVTSMSNKTDFLILQKLEFLLEEIETLELFTKLKWLEKTEEFVMKDEEKSETPNLERLETEAREIRSILGVSHKTKQNRDWRRQMIIDRNYINLFFRFSDEMKNLIVFSMNKIFGKEFLHQISLEQILDVLKRTKT